MSIVFATRSVAGKKREDYVGGEIVKRSIWNLAAGILLAVAASALVVASPALALAPSHVFDPVLSLTGGCTVSSYDPVPDPPREDGPQAQEIAECEAGIHPSESFVQPTGIATDPYGDVYVAVEGPSSGGVSSNPHVDVFDAQGHFLAEVSTPAEPKTVAVDSEGYLYVYTHTAGKNLLRYDPASSYDPAAGAIAYEPTPTVIDPEGWPFWPFYAALAVNPANDHLFVNFGTYLTGPGAEKVRSAIVEFGAGAAGTPLLDDEVAEVNGFFAGLGLAIDQSRGRIYATDEEPEVFPDSGLRLIRVFELAAPHNLIETFHGSSLPEGTFVKCGTVPDNCGRRITIAADESTGNIFVYDIEKKRVVYELDENGQYLTTIEHELLPKTQAGITVDNGANSPNGALNPEGRYLWVVDSPPGIGHADAFKPTTVGPPEVEVSFSNVTETEALLKARVNPNQAETTYWFEYVSKAQFEASEFAGAQVVGQGTIAAGTLPVSVSAQLRELAPGTSYVFRVVAQNEASPPLGEDEAEFTTFPAAHFSACPNDAARTGPSAALPDCRAYELVTPPDTGGRPPMGLGLGGALTFPTLPASPAGDRLSFRIENGVIPGFEGTGSLPGDPYLSTRGPGGWTTAMTGAKGTEAEAGVPGGRSPDQTYSAWAAEGQGPAVIEGQRTVYIRYPDGHSELLGQGSRDTDPQPQPKLISDGGAHMLFTSTVHLEDQAAASGHLSIYDRSATGATRVVSLLPGDITPSGSQEVAFRGSSRDGRGVAFNVTAGGITTLYLRRDDQTTYDIGAGLTFEGVAEGGGRVFYLQNGNLKAFDAATGETVSFAGGGDVTVVNVSADGSTAYFVSPDKLTSSPNPLGDQAIANEENLYRSREGAISFVGTLSARDVEGEGGNVLHNGLGLWVNAVGGAFGNAGTFAIDPSRTTADGLVLLLQSDADLTAYETEGSRQIYRYDAAADRLTCLSCNPTGAPPGGDALLQEVTESAAKPEPNTAYDLVLNLSTGGSRAFFQSPDRLVPADTDGLQDVYEWEAQGVGSCDETGGCTYLISSGRSEKVNYLYAASATGDDVFFRTADLLAPADREAVPSIYDARVGGGFLEEPSNPECEGEGCRPQLTQVPMLPTPPATPPGSGNVRKKCPKGKRAVKRAGRVRCVKKRRHRRHHRHHGRRKAGKAGQGGRK